MGGTLRVILNKPDSTKYSGAVEAQGTATKDGGTGYSVKGMVNVPLIEDKLAARLVLYEAEQGGYVDDVLLKKKDINDQHSTGGRLMLGFTPTDEPHDQRLGHLPEDHPGRTEQLVPLAGRKGLFDQRPRHRSDRATICASTTSRASGTWASPP
jgi:hypothetical protein